VVEVRASHGDTQLGGDDFDDRLAEHAGKLFYKKHQLSLKDNRVAMARLNRTAEAAKVRLSSYVDAPLREEYLVEEDGIPRHLDETISRPEFEEMTGELLERTIESLERVFEDAEVEREEINRVLLVGGATRMPAVWSLVADYTGLEPDTEINPDEVVALGAAIQAAIIAGEPVESILVDVTPYSLGIESAATVGRQIVPDIYSVLIHRNTTIPVTKEQIFQTVHPDQQAIHIKVYQGEAPIASANTLLGDFLIEDLKPAKPGRHPEVNVRFDFDVNGMLRVSATDRFTNQAKDIKVEATQVRLTPGEIEEARKRLAEIEFGEAPVIDEETEALLARAKSLLDSGTLSEAQITLLTDLLNEIDEAETQDELDDLTEELVDTLFDLE
jgi:molecular chaperone DnaK